MAMNQTNQLLGDPEIENFINTHLGAAERIEKAAKCLVDKDDGLKALKKLLPALSKDKINVFFSYKKKDEDAANAIVYVLRSKSAGKLTITYQAEFTKEIVGKRWRAKIRDSIRSANWFILLFPDPSDDWDWCLFETGLFEARLTSADRLICLHHPDIKIPDPIKDYHAVSATIPEVEKFIEMIFKKDNPICGMEALHKHMSQQEISLIAEDIVDAIRPLQRSLVRKTYEPWIGLKINTSLKNKDDLDQAFLIEANEEALNLFDFELKPLTFGELRSGLPEDENDDRWREELFHVISKIANKRKFSPIQAVFKTNDGQHFRPAACAVDRVGSIKGPVAVFHITFIEDVVSVDVSSTPKELSVLAYYLRSAYRFRWEILERFGTSPISEDNVERLYNTLERIRADARSRGISNIDTIASLFPTEKARRIYDMYNAWYKVSNPKKKGELDIAIKNKEVDKIQQILAEFIPMSQDFLEMTANRFSELVKD